MIDQAARLRELMKNNTNEPDQLVEVSDRAKVVSVSSGKGGVGKTNFALNFAISLKRLGYEVVVIDADLGLSNIEILSGCNLKYSISDIIFSDKDIFEIMGLGPEGIKIISGGSSLKEFRLLDEGNFSKLIFEIMKLQAKTDFIIIDTGAGISTSVLDFILATHEVIVVCTPDPTSLMDSYTLIKSLIYSGYIGKIKILSNMVSNRNEGLEIYNKLSTAADNFLKKDLIYFGYLESSKVIGEAIREQIPFIVSHPNDNASKLINIMTLNFLNDKNFDKEKEKTNFAKKIFEMFSKKR